MNKALVCMAMLFGVAIQTASAAELFFQSRTQQVHIGQEFYVDVMLDPERESINAIEASVSFPANLLYVGSSDDGSIMGTWIERPHDVGGKVSFSGIVPNGFAGFIDPREPKVCAAGKITRLIFRSQKSGTGIVDITSASLYINDGQGTLAETHSTGYPVLVDRIIAPSNIASNDHQLPEFVSAAMVSDENLFQGRPTVIFDVRDNGSGIDRVEIKEGLMPWRIAQSPVHIKYTFALFHVQLRAIDRAGNVSTTSIELPQRFVMRSYIHLGIIVFAVLALYAIIQKVLRR